MSATLQDPDSRATRSTRNVSIALIGPHIGRRSVVAKAVSGAEGRTVREFAAYPDKVSELPRLLAQNFDVVMIDLDSDQNYALQLVQEIAATGTVNVIVYSSRNDPTLGMISTHAGASDFLSIPADPSEEDEPGPKHPPERVAPPRPVEVRPEPRVPENVYLKDETERAWQQQPTAPRPNIQPSNGNHQNVAPVRAAAPAGRAPEAAPRPAIVPEPPPRAVPEPRPVPPQASVQAPVQRPVPSPVQSPVQRPVQFPVQSPVQNPVQNPIQSAVQQRPVQSPTQNAVQRPVQSPVPSQSAVQSPVSSPVQSTIPVPAQTPVQRTAAAPVQAPPPVSSPSVDQQSAAEAAPRLPGAIQTDADVLELFKYGKGQVKEIKDPDELPPSNSKKWVFISVGAVVVIAVVALVVFMLSSHPKTQVAPPTPQVASQAVIPAATTPADTIPAATQPIAKPSPTVPLAAAPAGQPVEAAPKANQVSSDMMDAQLSAQSRISSDIKKAAPEEEPPAGGAPVSMESNGGVQGANFSGFNKVNVVPVVSQVSAGVAEGMAIHKTAPVYPKIAKDSHVSGTVVLGATINRSGMIENVHVISGSQMLRGAAVDAVKTWRYRPYMLNNQPVAVQTTINVVFSLGRE
jgi:periplasmic protein TonB